MQSIYLH